MGCDINVALGKIKPLAIGYERKGSAIQLAGIGDDLDFSQFEFMNYKEDGGYYDTDENDHRHIPRDYDLFSWLVGIRGDLEPLLPEESLEKLRELTREFSCWANKEDRRIFEDDAKQRGVQPSYDGYGYGEEWSSRYVSGDHSHVIYPLLLLKGFDYSQKVRVRPQRKWETLEQYGARVQQYQDHTYQTLFPVGYFGFLDWALEHGWHFAIFTFDS